MTVKRLENSMKLTAAMVVASMAAGFGGAVSAQSDPMTHPINCATAEGDIRALNAEKEHAKDHQLRNITAIIPAGALLGIIKGDEKQKLQMLSGDYEKKIDERIAATKAECNLK